MTDKQTTVLIIAVLILIAGVGYFAITGGYLDKPAEQPAVTVVVLYPCTSTESNPDCYKVPEDAGGVQSWTQPERMPDDN